jgi:hypothetical protein
MRARTGTARIAPSNRPPKEATHVNEQTQPTSTPEEDLVKDLEPREEEAEVKGGGQSNEMAIEGFGSFEPK